MSDAAGGLLLPSAAAAAVVVPTPSVVTGCCTGAWETVLVLGYVAH